MPSFIVAEQSSEVQTRPDRSPRKFLTRNSRQIHTQNLNYQREGGGGGGGEWGDMVDKELKQLG